MLIIYGADYKQFLCKNNILSLFERRELLCKRFLKLFLMNLHVYITCYLNLETQMPLIDCEIRAATQQELQGQLASISRF